MDEKRDAIVRAIAWAGAGIAGVVVLAFALLFALDLSFLLRHPIETALTRVVGRQVIVNGEVRLIAWPHPAARLSDVFIANVGDGTRPDLALAHRVEARLSLGGFPRICLVVGDVDADRVSVTLERSKTGMSWMPGRVADRVARGEIKVRNVPFPVTFEPGSLIATNVTFAVRMPWQSTAMIYPVDRLSAQSGGPLGTYLALVGHIGREAWRADADLSSFQALVTGAPFKVKARASGLGARVAVAGTMSFDSSKTTDLFGIGSAADTQRLWGARAGAPAPASFTFSLKNTVEDETLLAHFQKLGAGDLDVALEFAGLARDRLTGHITAKTLDLAAFPHLSLRSRGKNLFSDKPIAVNALAHSQIDLKIGAESVNWRDARVGRLELGIWSNNGILAAGPITLDGPETQMTGDATLDLRAVPKLSVSLKAKLANLGALVRPGSGDAASAKPATPTTRADLAFELLGTGNSPAQIMATAYGQTDLLVGPGDAGGALASALPIEIAYGLRKDHSLVPPPNADRPLNLACLVSRFDIAEGRATSRALFIDTSAATTTGEGAIDFTNEALDFHLTPRPKDPDLISQARDIDLHGTLSDPVFAPQDAATKGLSRLASETALAPASDIIMPLLAPEAVLANPCVRSLMSESALAGLRQRPAAKGGGRAEAP